MTYTHAHTHTHTHSRKPILYHQTVDLYRFYEEVLVMGGYDEMIQDDNKGSWIRVFRKLYGHAAASGATSASWGLKRNYEVNNPIHAHCINLLLYSHLCTDINCICMLCCFIV